MSDWDESSSSPEAGQQAFHEAITPVQSSPSASEPDDDDFDGFASRDTRPEVGQEREDSSSGEDVPVESAAQLIDNRREPEDSASNDEDKPSSAASDKDDSVEGRDDRHGEAPSKEGVSDDEEKDEDSRSSSTDNAANPLNEETGSASRKRLLDSSSEDDEHPSKKLKTADDGDSDDESEEEESLQAKPAIQGDVGEGTQPEAGDGSEGDGGDQEQVASLQQQQQEGQEEDDDSDGVVDEGKSSTDVSDFDLMMQRRKEAMSRARRRRRKDIYLTSNDDHIVELIRDMKLAAEEDCRLNIARKAAVKKLQLLPIVISNLKKADFVLTFIECGICSALADWLQPLPDHSLPHLKIRDSILDILRTFPDLDSTILKTSNLGKSVMRLYRHPKETRKNRDKAGKLINNWARPIFGLTSNFKAMSRREREERDYEHLSQAARRRLSSSGESSKKAQEEEEEPTKPGDKGWVGRARVPMPSNKDYVVRPAWKVAEHEMRRGSSKKPPNRYEKHLRSQKATKSKGRTTHAVSISVEGRRMPL